MRRTTMAVTAAAVAVLTAFMVGEPSASAQPQPICQTDGLAKLCVTDMQGSDAVGMAYQVTQLDGPGTYSLFYVDQHSGAAGPPVEIGPLDWQAAVSGQLRAKLGTCYDLHLTSTTGTSLVTGPVCG